MGKIILILGGARSGKSALAVSLAKKYKRVAFIATCQGLDKEMRRRIRMHRKKRPAHWQTFEAYQDPAALLGRIGDSFECIIVDCLTLLVSNLLLDGCREKAILKKIGALLCALRKKRAVSVLVSNEVGSGIVPANELSRDFRDVAGKVNQMAARRADQAFFMVAGLPLKLKEE